MDRFWRLKHYETAKFSIALMMTPITTYWTPAEPDGSKQVCERELPVCLHVTITH